jgi:nucleotide-binding universal stress UspA family protein
MTSQHILAVASTSHYNRDLADQIIAEARILTDAGGVVEISLLYIIEVDTLAEVRQKIGRDGFLGHSARREVIEALTETQHQVADARLEFMRERLEAAGYPVTVTQVEGAFTDAVLAHVAEHPSDIVLLTRADRPLISRILFGSETDRVARMVREDALGRVIITDE